MGRFQMNGGAHGPVALSTVALIALLSPLDMVACSPDPDEMPKQNDAPGLQAGTAAATGGTAPIGGTTSPSTGGVTATATGGTGGTAAGGTGAPMMQGPDAMQPDAGDDTPAADASNTPGTTQCATQEEELFSFFMVSREAIVRESGSEQGFGGNLGGIEGADDICRRVALTSSDCAGNKTWRAFLSTTKEDAIDRIGQGPWHDRVGRLLANEISELLNDRPINADPAIIDDFPNEFGIPNHDPQGNGQLEDNHQTLTGSGIDGRLYGQRPEDDIEPMGGRGGGFGSSTTCRDGEWTPEKATCWDWTVAEPRGCPRVGHSWPRQGSGINWISVWNENGCAPGIVLDDRTAPPEGIIGAYGGYGGFYCFAM